MHSQRQKHSLQRAEEEVQEIRAQAGCRWVRGLSPILRTNLSLWLDTAFIRKLRQGLIFKSAASHDLIKTAPMETSPSTLRSVSAFFLRILGRRQSWAPMCG